MNEGLPLAGVAVGRLADVWVYLSASPLLGLTGLAERASLAGGELRHGPDRSGRYVVAAWLPWS